MRISRLPYELQMTSYTIVSSRSARVRPSAAVTSPGRSDSSMIPARIASSAS